jgi:hypothetical protein
MLPPSNRFYIIRNQNISEYKSEESAGGGQMGKTRHWRYEMRKKWKKTKADWKAEARVLEEDIHRRIEKSLREGRPPEWVLREEYCRLYERQIQNPGILGG